MAIWGSVIGGVIGLGGSLLSSKGQQRSNAANQQVDLNNMSPEGRKALEGLFGTFSDLAKSGIGDLSKSAENRTKITNDALVAGLTTALNRDLPGLQGTMNSAGAYNSTAYGNAANDAITSSLAKFFFEAQSTAQKDDALDLEKLTPILNLLGIDKGSLQKGKAAGSGDSATGATNQFGSGLSSNLLGIFGALSGGGGKSINNGINS